MGSERRERKDKKNIKTYRVRIYSWWGNKFFLKIKRFKCDIHDTHASATVDKPYLTGAVEALCTLLGYSILVKDHCLANIQNTMV